MYLTLSRSSPGDNELSVRESFPAGNESIGKLDREISASGETTVLKAEFGTGIRGVYCYETHIYRARVVFTADIANH